MSNQISNIIKAGFEAFHGISFKSETMTHSGMVRWTAVAEKIKAGKGFGESYAAYINHQRAPKMTKRESAKWKPVFSAMEAAL